MNNDIKIYHIPSDYPFTKKEGKRIEAQYTKKCNLFYQQKQVACNSK